jgi:hypothetical protein
VQLVMAVLQQPGSQVVCATPLLAGSPSLHMVTWGRARSEAGRAQCECDGAGLHGKTRITCVRYNIACTGGTHHHQGSCFHSSTAGVAGWQIHNVCLPTTLRSLRAATTVSRILEEMDTHPVDLVVHVGDLAYADGRHKVRRGGDTGVAAAAAANC